MEGGEKVCLFWRKTMAKLYINEKKKKGHINPEIYGHFSEHLGTCLKI